MKSAQYWLGYWDRAREISADYSMLSLIVDIQNDAIRGVGSTPVNKKSSTPLKQKTAKVAPATLDPILTYTADDIYIVEWDGYSEVFAADSPNGANYPSKQAGTEAIAVLSESGFRPAQPMIWVRQSENRWMLVPQNEWKDDTVAGDIYSGNAD